MKPLQEKAEFNICEISKESILFYSWYYDKALKKGQWEIVNNIPVQDNYEMPIFVRPDMCFEEHRPLYELVKMNNDCLKYESLGIETTVELYENYPLCGIGNEISEPRLYFIKLKKHNLI